MKITIPALQRKYLSGEKITMLTSYDYTLARLVDQAGIDMFLVGDSASNIVSGNDTTLPISLDEMIFLTKGVVRAAQEALVVFDMPFGSYQCSIEQGLANAVRALKETGANAVKLEGGREVAPLIKQLVQAGIPVMGHIGLRPQSVNVIGGYHLSTNEDDLLEDALALEEAGCFSIVLEKVPAVIATKITAQLTRTFTIGIGAGNGTDGQVLVLHDMLGLNPLFHPKFVRRFAELGNAVTQAVEDYIVAVKDGSFPNDEESY